MFGHSLSLSIHFLLLHFRYVDTVLELRLNRATEESQVVLYNIVREAVLQLLKDSIVYFLEIAVFARKTKESVASHECKSLECGGI